MKKYFKKFKESAFRLELFQTYEILDEDSYFAIFLETGNVGKSVSSEWCEIVKQAQKRGAEMKRVHVIEFPLSDYIKFELEAYKYSIQAGEEIKLITKEKFDSLNITQEFDFWLFDDEIVLRMDYSLNGKFVGLREEKENTSKFVELKKVLLKESTNFRDFRKRSDFGRAHTKS